MEIIQTIESAAHTATEAVEHPFHTIGTRLTAVARSFTTFFQHPYCAPDLAAGLAKLHTIVADLAQEVAELRVPCPCKPAPTSTASTSTAAGDAAPPAPAATAKVTGDDFAVVTNADLADFRAWQKAKADAASFTGLTVV